MTINDAMGHVIFTVRDIYSHIRCKNVVSISAAVQKLLQRKYAGRGNVSSPLVACARRPNSVSDQKVHIRKSRFLVKYDLSYNLLC